MECAQSVVESPDNRLVGVVKGLMWVSDYVFISFATFFLFINLISAMSNGGTTTNDFNKYGEMYVEVVILSVLFGLSLGNKIIESNDRRETIIKIAFSGTLLVFLGIGMYLLGMAQ